MGKLASIIVVTCNRKAFCKMAITSILKNTHFPYELIILDNGSTDGTVEYLKYIEEKYPTVSVHYYLTNQGKAKAANHGFRISKGDYIIGLDDDVLVPKGWLTKMTNALDRTPNIGWLSFSLEKKYWKSFNRNGKDPNVFKPEYERKYRGYTIQMVPAVAGFCVAMPRSTYEKLGGYAEKSYYGGVDGEYNRRAKAHGLITGYLMEVVGVHLGGSEEEANLYPDYRNYKFDTQKQLKNGNYQLAQCNFFMREIPPEIRKQGQLLKGNKRAAVYFVYKGKKHLIPSETAFHQFGFSWNDVKKVHQNKVDQIPSGDPIDPNMQFL